MENLPRNAALAAVFTLLASACGSGSSSGEGEEGGDGEAESDGDGQYDPVTNSVTWTATSTPGVPAERWITAIWIGSEMIVWSGSVGDDEASSILNTGARYRP